MTATLTPGIATTGAGAPLPLVALPQDSILTVNENDIPLLKDAAGPGIHLQTLRLDPQRGELVILATIAAGRRTADPLSHRYRRGVHAGGPLGVPRVPRPAADRRVLLVRARRRHAHLLHSRRQHRRHRHSVVDARRPGQLQRRRHLPLPDRRRHHAVSDRDRGGRAGRRPRPLHPRRRRPAGSIPARQGKRPRRNHPPWTPQS